MGFFKVDNIQAGIYQLFSEADGYAQQENQFITIESDKPNVVDILLYPSAILKGIVLDDQQQPITGASLYLQSEMVKADIASFPPQLESLRVYESDINGQFEIPAVSINGDALIATHASLAPVLYQLQPDWKNNSESLIIYMNHGGSIAGSVIDENNNPLSQSEIIYYNQLDFPWLVGQTSTREDGTFRLDNLSPVMLTLHCFSVKSEQTSQHSQKFMVKQNQVTTLQFQLSNSSSMTKQ